MFPFISIKLFHHLHLTRKLNNEQFWRRIAIINIYTKYQNSMDLCTYQLLKKMEIQFKPKNIAKIYLFPFLMIYFNINKIIKFNIQIFFHYVSFILKNFYNLITIIQFKMSQNDFKKKQFEQALKVTKKIKTNLKPYLQQFSKSDKQIADISAIWQAVQILHYNLTSPTVDSLIKMNSMFGVKCIIDTCDYVCHQFIQAYIFPVIKRAALTDLNLKEEERGTKLFTGSNQAASHGFNYVKLCTQMVRALAGIKPFRLYYSQQTKDSSQYMLTYNHIIKNSKQKQNDFVFFKDLKETPDKLKKLYASKLLQFNENSEAYSKFIEQKFTQQIKGNFEGQQLDIRQLLKCSDCYISQDILQIVGDVFQKAKSCNLLRQALCVVNCFVLSGDSHARLFLHENPAIKNLVKSVINIQSPSKNVNRGQYFLPEKKGSPQDRKQLYCEFLRCLDLWANTFPKNQFKSNTSPSKINKYYKILKQDFKFEFPSQAMLSKLVGQSEQNFKKREDFNKILRKQALQQDFPQQIDDSVILAKRASDLPLSSKHSLQINSLSRNNQEVHHNTLKAETIPQNPKYETTPGDPRQNQGGKFIEKIKKLQNIVSSLTSSERELPKNMSLLQKQAQEMQSELERLNVSEQEFDEITNIFFATDQKLKRITPIYQEYRKNKIDFRTFCNKVNGKMQASRIASTSKLPESKQLIQQPIKKQEDNKMQLSSKPVIPTLKQLPPQQNDPKPPSNKSLQNVKYANQNSYSGSKLQSQREISKAAQIPQNKKEPEFIMSHDNFASKVDPSDIPQRNDGSRGFSKNHVYQSITVPVVNVIPSQPRLPKVEALHENGTPHKVEFERSEMGQSRYTNTIYPPQNQSRYIQHSPKGEIVTYDSKDPNIISIASRDQIHAYPENRTKTFNRKFGDNNQMLQKQQQSQAVDYKPITVTQKHQPISTSNQYLLSPIKNQDLRIDDAEDPIYVNDDQFIQGPSLNPLDCSYHDFQEASQKAAQKSKNFKDVFNSNNMFIKTNKRQNLFKLQSESNSLIKPAMSANKKSRVQSKVSVPQLLQERSKKYQIQMKLMEQNKNMKIRQLQNRLQRVQREKTTISNQLKDRQIQIRTMRQNSDADPVKSKADQYSLIEDQNYLMKKITANNAVVHSMAHLPKKLAQSGINHSRILASGQLINTKIFAPYFNNFKNEKQKKVHMKNKQLLYKDKQLEIGYMGHIQDNSFKVTCFITPEDDFLLEQMHVEADENIRVEYDQRPQLAIQQGRQYREEFLITILQAPYNIPFVHLKYRINNKPRKTSFVLPCAFHKFFTIKCVDQTSLAQQFQSQKIIRGEEIPYSKRILKNTDLLKDFLPHIEKLNKGQPNDVGEICFGGEANYKRLNFPIKVSVKPNQFLYIQIIDKKYSPEQRRMIDFYVATVNHFLMKEINWQQLTSQMAMSATK